MGFYIIAEADLETHGAFSIYNSQPYAEGEFDYEREHPSFGLLCHDPQFSDAMLDRVQRSVIRDKNCAAILMWSLGNESSFGPNLERAAHWVKTYDPTRLTHYESSIYYLPDKPNDLSDIDVYSRMYSSPAACDMYCEEDVVRPTRSGWARLRRAKTGISTAVTSASFRTMEISAWTVWSIQTVPRIPA